MRILAIFLLISVIFNSSVFAQKAFFDPYRQQFNEYGFADTAGVGEITLFRTGNPEKTIGGMKAKAILEEGRIKTISYYNLNELRYAKYSISKIEGENLKVEKFTTGKKPEYTWILRDSLPVEECFFSELGKLKRKWVFEYKNDTMINCIKCFKGNGELIYEEIYSYNNLKKLITISQVRKGKIQLSENYTYNTKGDISEFTFKNDDGKLKKSEVYTYNKNGELETVIVSNNKESYLEIELKYEKGCLVNKKEYRLDFDERELVKETYFMRGNKCKLEKKLVQFTQDNRKLVDTYWYTMF